MKLKFSLSIFMLATLALNPGSCSGNSKAEAEQARLDSIAREDSIRAVETAAEAARLDSIRKDFTKKETEFLAIIPSSRNSTKPITSISSKYSALPNR